MLGLDCVRDDGFTLDERLGFVFHYKFSNEFCVQRTSNLRERRLSLSGIIMLSHSCWVSRSFRSARV